MWRVNEQGSIRQERGAFPGGLTGPAAPIAVPVLGLPGGIGGSFGGDWLAREVVDLTYVED